MKYYPTYCFNCPLKKKKKELRAYILICNRQKWFDRGEEVKQFGRDTYYHIHFGCCNLKAEI